MADQAPQQTPVTIDPVATPAIPPVPSTLETPSSVFSLRDFARGQGVDVTNFQDEESAAKAMFDELRQSRAIAAWAQQQIPQREPEPAPKPAAAEPEEWTEDAYFTKRWDVPAYDQQWEGMVKSGAIVKEDGRWVASPDYPWMAANPALAALNSWEERRSGKLTGYLNDNLPKKLWEDFREPLDKRYLTRDQVTQMLAERDANTYLARVENELAPMLYKDPANVPDFRDPRFAANLTEYGKGFFQVFDDLASLNPQASENDLVQRALRYAPPPTASPAAPAVPAGTPAVMPAAPAPPQPSFLDDSLARAQNRPSGSAAPAAASPGPKHVSSLDLKNLIRAA